MQSHGEQQIGDGRRRRVIAGGGGGGQRGSEEGGIRRFAVCVYKYSGFGWDGGEY